jgi:hypothetical protein
MTSGMSFHSSLSGLTNAKLGGAGGSPALTSFACHALVTAFQAYFPDEYPDYSVIHSLGSWRSILELA